MTVLKLRMLTRIVADSETISVQLVGCTNVITMVLSTFVHTAWMPPD